MKWATGSIAAVFALVFSLVIGASGASGAAACGGGASVNVAASPRTRAWAPGMRSS